MTIRRRDLLAALPAMAAAATVPRAFAQGTAPVKGGTLRMWIVEPIMLTGAFNSAGQIYQISGKMFDGLGVRLQPQSDPEACDRVEAFARR